MRYVISAFTIVLAWSLAIGSCRAQIPPRSRATQTAPTADYFPLAVGNSWTYAVEGRVADGSVTVQVTDSTEIGGRRYFQIEGYTPNPAWVRLTDSGRLVEYRRDSGAEHLWYEFRVPEGTVWESELPRDCLGSSKLASRNAQVETPAGAFDSAIEITYGPTTCADAGIEREDFAAGIGLVRRTEITIAGPRSMLLVEASVGGRTISAAGLSFSLSIDRPIYFPNLMPPVDPERAIPTLRARLTIRNSTDLPLRLTFPTGQRFDLVVRNQSGEQILRWSRDKLFTQAMGTLDLSPGTRTFAAELQLGEGASPLRPGLYVAEAWLTTTNPEAYRAKVAFEIGEPVF